MCNCTGRAYQPPKAVFGRNVYAILHLDGVGRLFGRHRKQQILEAGLKLTAAIN